MAFVPGRVDDRYECVRFWKPQCWFPPRMVCHSDNISRRRNDPGSERHCFDGCLLGGGVNRECPAGRGNQNSAAHLPDRDRSCFIQGRTLTRFLRTNRRSTTQTAIVGRTKLSDRLAASILSSAGSNCAGAACKSSIPGLPQNHNLVDSPLPA